MPSLNDERVPLADSQNFPPADVAANRRRCTREQQVSRIHEVLLFIVGGKTKGEIRRELRNKYQLRSRQADRYISKARDRLANERGGLPTSVLVDQSYGFYMSVLADGMVDTREKLKARELADKLLGLQAPSKFAATTAAGDDLARAAVKDLSDEEIEILVRARERMSGICAGDSGRGTN